MRILVSAFACSPTGGSEGGVGWHWANALQAAGHDVTVLTDTSRQAAIRNVLAEHAGNAPRFVFHRPRALAGVRLSRRSAQLLYSAWQYLLLPRARALHREHRFELILHVTYGVFRHPSFLGFIDVPFVFGPVGGGEDAPWRLKRGLPARERLKEAVRTLLNVLARFNPFLQLALARADLVLCKTSDTLQALPRHAQRKARVQLEIGVDPTAYGAVVPPSPRDAAATFHVLYAGRLLGLKGLDLALEAFAALRATHPDCRFTLVGSGPLADWVDRKVRQLGLERSVERHDHMPQPELFALYGSAHCLLFPSLHDSSGNVVLEALWHGLPVVCLDRGGPATIVCAECAYIVSTDGSRAAVVDGLTKAMRALHDDEPHRHAMSRAALRHAASSSWDVRVARAMSLIEETIEHD